MAMFVKPPKTQFIKYIFFKEGKRRPTWTHCRSQKQNGTKKKTLFGYFEQSKHETKEEEKMAIKAKLGATKLLKPPQVMNSFLNQFSGAGIFQQTSSCGSNKTGKLIRGDLTSRCASIKETSASTRRLYNF